MLLERVEARSSVKRPGLGVGLVVERGPHGMNRQQHAPIFTQASGDLVDQRATYTAAPGAGIDRNEMKFGKLAKMPTGQQDADYLLGGDRDCAHELDISRCYWAWLPVGLFGGGTAYGNLK